MVYREPKPMGYEGLGASLHEELEFKDGEMLEVSEAGIAAFLEAAKDSDNVITDTVVYREIPHHNNLRTLGIVLGLRSRPIKNITIEVPRKSDDLAIKITAQDMHNPNRRYIFTEITNGGYGDDGDFIVDDTDWENSEKANSPVDQLMSKTEIAHWLYRQAGVSEPNTYRKLKTETDPVQDAAHALSVRAQSIDAQRQVKVKVNDSLTFIGEEISVHSPDELVLQPSTLGGQAIVKARPTRMYTVWVNAVYDTDMYGAVKETILANFSPDNPILMIPNVRSSMSLSIETTKSLSQSQIRALLNERKHQASGNVSKLFEGVAKRLAEHRPAA